MGSSNGKNTKIESCIEAEPVVVGTRTVQPIVRVTGWRFGGDGDGTGPVGALLRMTAREIIVREGDGEEILAMTDPLADSGRRLGRQALLLAGICLFIMFLARRMSRTAVRHGHRKEQTS